jgi:anti-sigma regulatory factor (Ser/Thr protein kinase)
MPQLQLPAEPASISHARRFVRGAVESLGAEAAVDDAVLLISELATNALLHARSPLHHRGEPQSRPRAHLHRRCVTPGTQGAVVR